MPKSKDKIPPPWSRRPWPDRGDKADDIHRMVGRALSHWEDLEFTLSELFASFVDSKSAITARRAFASVRTFQGRFELLKSSSEAFYYQKHLMEIIADKEYKDEDQELFKSMLPQMSALGERRNEIAHGWVGLYANKDFTRVEGEELCALYPSLASYKERDIGYKPTYCMTTSEISHFIEQFDELNRKIQSFTEKVDPILPTSS